MSSPDSADAPPSAPLPGTPLPWRLGLLAAVVVLGGVAFLTQQAGLLGPRGQAAVGVVCFLMIAATVSVNLRAVNWRTVGVGLGLQLILAVCILKVEINGVRPFFEVLRFLGGLVGRFLDFSLAGSKFVFGPLADRAFLLNDLHYPEGYAVIFAFRILPTVIFVSSFFTLLYYFGVLQLIVRLMARLMMRLMGTSGAETLSAAANVFMGQTEAPLIIKPYIPKMTRSELMALMVGGMATISGGVMAAFIGMGADPVAILATSVMAAPSGLYLSKLLVPELEEPQTRGVVRTNDESPHVNAVDALSAGASDGLSLALNIAAMLIAFLAMIALTDALLGGIKPLLLAAHDTVGLSAAWLGFWPDDLSLTWICSRLFAPVAFLMGASGADVPRLADLLGTKLVANEFVAFVKLTSPDMREELSPRAFRLATYALTGFANFSSIGIQLGGIGAMAPERRKDLASLGTRALLAGFLATVINASIAGMMMSDEV